MAYKRMEVRNFKFLLGAGRRDVTPAHPRNFIYNSKTKVIQMETMVIQMHTNGVLKGVYEKPAILHMGWAGETYVKKILPECNN